MCDYEDVIEQDVKTIFKDHFGYGQHSIEQFWRLEGEAICEAVYEALTEVLIVKEANYSELIGDIEL